MPTPFLCVRSLLAERFKTIHSISRSSAKSDWARANRPIEFRKVERP
jgi:hypothetical protein